MVSVQLLYTFGWVYSAVSVKNLFTCVFNENTLGHYLITIVVKSVSIIKNLSNLFKLILS